MQKTPGYATTSGQEYEVALCCLLFLRALRFARDFFLFSNHAQAGKFDDVVVFYRLKGDRCQEYRAILVQAKHKETFKRKPLSSCNPFLMRDYLESFKAVRKFWEKPVNVESQLIELQEVSLVLYSNTGCEIGDVAVDVTNVPEVRHLRDFLNTGGGRLLRISKARRVGLREEEETSAFLGHLLLCTEQMNVEKADSVLEEEISSMLKLTSPEVARSLNAELKRVMKVWWGEGTVRYLTAESQEWCKVLEVEIKRLNDDTSVVDGRLNLDFTKSALEEFDAVQRRSKLTWIRVTDEHQAAAVRLRLFRVQNNSLVVSVSSLKNVLEEVEVLWGSKICSTLALDMSAASPGEASPMLQRLQEAVHGDASRHLVVIARGNPTSGGWSQVDPETTWSVLRQDTRVRLLEAPVRLQGEAVALRDVLGGPQVGDVMSDDVISSVCMCDTEMELGAAMPAPLEYYLSRCLQRTSTREINFCSLQNTKTLIFSSSSYLSPKKEFTKGLNTLSLSDINTSNQITDLTYVEGMGNVYDIQQLCSRFRVRGIAGEISQEGLQGNVEEFIPFPWICEEKIVVIEGPPGVGKSSFVTMMCSSVKEQFPEAWVLRLDMGRHSDHIKSTDFAEVNDIKEFLFKGLNKDPNNLEQRLLEHSLSVMGNVFLFLDAFDEISPDFTSKCCDLLKGIAQTIRYRQMVVTTRPVTTKDVEEALQTKAFTLPVFHEEEQVLFLKQFSAAKGKPVGEEDISSLRHSAGTALKIPLLCRMASEVLLQRQEQLFLRCLNPWRKVLLYEIFVKQTVINRLAEKFELEASVPGIRRLLEYSSKQHLESLQELAAMKLMPPGQLPNLCTWMEAPEEKLGLVVNTGGDGIDFEHQTFAEFFLGRWLARHWQQCPRELLGRGSFRAGFQFVTATFNWSLFGDLPLHVAVARGDEGAVREHLASWTTDRGGRSPLHVAAMSQSVRREVWELLVASGEDLIRKDDVLEMTAVEYAVLSGNFLLVVSILEEDETEVNRAMKEGATSLCEFILSKKKDFSNSFDKQGSTLLHLAAAGNFTRAMRILIRIRHELNVKDNIGYTPLHRASNYGHLEAVRLLTDSGADLNMEDEWGYTPLTWAARGGHLEVVKVLLDRGADFNMKSTLGNTPLEVAARGGHLEVVKVLLERGADVNAKNDGGDTPLIDAAREGHLEVVKTLVGEGADFNIRNNVGDSALMVAAHEGHLKVVKLLEEKAAEFTV